MIAQDENVQTTSTAEQMPTPPQIDSEVDIPFDGTLHSYQGPRPSNLSKTDSLDEQITKFKYLTGKTVLFTLRHCRCTLPVPPLGCESHSLSVPCELRSRMQSRSCRYSSAGPDRTCHR